MRIAIVGSGVSGISALWVSLSPRNQLEQVADDQLLNEYSDHEVNIYEKDSRLGGHTNTVEFKRKLLRSKITSPPADCLGDGKESCMVDT
jgi:predicted NAD/FAD-binding protein